VFLAGNFDSFHDVPRRGLAQLTTNGIVDNTFDPGLGINSGTFIYTIAQQVDGKLIVAGDFTSYDGHSIASIARVNTSGQLDLAFTPPAAPDAVIGVVAAPDDGTIRVGGRCGTFCGFSRRSRAR